MLSDFIQVICDTKNYSLTFYIELSSKSVGVGLSLALLKDKYGDPHFFLKGKMIVREIKANI